MPLRARQLLSGLFISTIQISSKPCRFETTKIKDWDPHKKRIPKPKFLDLFETLIQRNLH